MKHSWTRIITALGITALPITFGALGCATQDQAKEADEVNASNAAPEEGEHVGTASQAACVCKVHCTVAKVKQDAYCPPTIGGEDRTTFLGPCAKACGWARGNAQSKLGDGCVLDECSETTS